MRWRYARGCVMPRDNKPPAFMFYVDDFSSDDKVESMSTEAVGCYILLLCKAWRASPPATIPDDDLKLARWARVSDERWIELRPQVLAPWVLGSDGRWLQRRLRKEYDKQRARAVALSTSGKKGAAKRWQAYGNAIGDANGDAIATEYGNGSEPAIENVSSETNCKSTSKRARGKRFVKPTVAQVKAYCAERKNRVDPQAFVDFYESKGWMVGRNPMKDWQAAIRTWEKNSNEVSYGKRTGTPRVGPGQQYDPNDTGDRSF